MVVNSLVSSLMDTGLSEYEARAYVALTREFPATAYEVARRAGIPTPKIYGVVARLVERGIFSVSTASNKKNLYVPQETGEFIDALRGRVEGTLTQIEGGLAGLPAGEGMSSVWGIQSLEGLLQKAERMIKGARGTLLLSIHRDEANQLIPALELADSRRIKIAAIHFGQPDIHMGAIYRHPIKSRKGAERRGERGVVVVVDSEEALVGSIAPDGETEGAVSRNKGFVKVAEQYVKHDIYSMKLIRRFDREFRASFGGEYEKLMDVFSDEALS